MDKKILIAIVAAVALVAAGAGAFLLMGGGSDTTGSSTLTIDKEDTYTGGTYDYVKITSAVGEGTVTLVGMTILKELIINGGGSHSVNIDGCAVAAATVEKEGGEAVHINAKNSTISAADIRSNVILDGDSSSSFDMVSSKDVKLTINSGDVKSCQVTGGSVSMAGGTIEKIEVQMAPDSFDQDVSLILSGGRIRSADLHADCDVKLTVGNEASIDSLTYGDGVSISTSDAKTDEKVSAAEQKMADGASSNSITYNGVSKHVHSYRFSYADYENTLDKTTLTVTAHYVCDTCEESAEGHEKTETVSVTRTVTEPTCTEQGYTTYTTGISGDNSYRSDYTAALGHDYQVSAVWNDDHSSVDVIVACTHDSSHGQAFKGITDIDVKKTDATCTEDGSIVYTATVTFENVQYEATDTVVLEKLGHKWTFMYADYENTLDKSAKTVTAHYMCENNNEHTRTETVAVLSEIVNPTCTEGGYTRYYTGLSGDNGWTADQTDALGHDYGDPAYEWADDGSTCKVTIVCKRDQTNSVSETYNSTPTDSKDATCTEAGYKKFSVSGTLGGVAFSDTLQIDIPALGHDFSIMYGWADDCSSCTVTFVCSRNAEHNNVLDGEVKSSVLIQPGCTTAGKTKYYVSGEYEGVQYYSEKLADIATLGHEYGDYVYEWSADHLSCTATQTCSRCGDEKVVEAVVTSQVTKEPAIGVAGSKRYTATFEGGPETQTYDEVLPALSGCTVTVFGGTASAAGYEAAQVLTVPEGTAVTVTCTAAANDRGYWTDDKGDYIPVLNQDGEPTFKVYVDCDFYFTHHPASEASSENFWGEWTTVKNATCTEDGLLCRTATGDDTLKEYQSIPATGHVSDGVEVVDREATCTEDGLKHTTCTVCDEEIYETIPATGHEWSEWTVKTQAGGATVGTLVRTCSACGATEEKQYIDPVVPTGPYHISYVWTSEHGWETVYRYEDHTSWTIQDGNVERRAYLYGIQNIYDLKQLDTDVTSWFFWVDYGEHSPVYGARLHQPGTPVTVDYAWAVVGYVDSYDDFIYFIDRLDVGVDNGRNSSYLFDTYQLWAEEFNAGRAGYYNKEAVEYDGRYVTNYWSKDGTTGYYVDENNCCVRYAYEHMFTYVNRPVYQKVAIETEFAVPFSQGYTNALEDKDNGYFHSMPTLETAVNYTVNVIDGSYVTSDRTESNQGAYVEYYNLENLDLEFKWVYPEVPAHYEFSHLEVRDLNGKWWEIPTGQYKVTGYVDLYTQGFYMDESNEWVAYHAESPTYTLNTLGFLYDYLSHAHPDSFVMPSDPAFDGIWIRCVSVPEEKDCTVTVTGGTYSETWDGDRAASGSIYSASTIYLFDSNTDTQWVDHWTVVVDDGEAIELSASNGDIYSNSYYVEEGAKKVVVTAVYADIPYNHVKFATTEGGSNDGVAGDYLPYARVLAIATPDYGYRFVGWYVLTEGGEQQGGLIVEGDEGMVLEGDDDPYAEYGTRYYSDSRDLEYYIYDEGLTITLTSVFEAVSVEDMLPLYTVNGYACNPDTGVWLTSVYGYSESYFQIFEDPDAGAVYRWDVSYECGTENECTEKCKVDDGDEMWAYPSSAYTLVLGQLDGEIVKYTLSYDLNGVEGSIEPVTVAYDEAEITVYDTEPTREGYNFLGWNTAQDGSETTYQAGADITLTGNVTLYAKWEKITLTIRFSAPVKSEFFNVDLGNGVKTASVEYGDDYTVPAGIFTCSVGTLTAWKYWDNTTEKYVQIAIDGTGVVPDVVLSTTLYAVLDCYTYALHFDANGGTGTMDDETFTAADVDNYGKYTIKQTDFFTRQYHDFNGWLYKDLDVNGSREISVLDYIAASVEEGEKGCTFELDAKWRETSYGINRMANIDSYKGSTQWIYFVVSDGTVNLNQKDSLYSEDGKILYRWTSNQNGTGSAFDRTAQVPVEDLLPLLNEYGNVLLYGQWAPETLEISFYGYQDTEHPYVQEATNNSEVTLVSRYTMWNAEHGGNFNPDDITFMYWTTDTSDDDAPRYSDEQTAVLVSATGKLNLYSVWHVNEYNIYFYPEVGFNSPYIQYGIKYGVATNLDSLNTMQIYEAGKPHYDTDDRYFLGWTADLNDPDAYIYADEEEVTSLTTTGSFSLYAIWADKVYDIRFYASAESQTPYTQYGVAYNADPSATLATIATIQADEDAGAAFADPQGMTFAYWVTDPNDPDSSRYGDGDDVNFVTSEGVVSLYAVWAYDPYSIVYHPAEDSQVGYIQNTGFYEEATLKTIDEIKAADAETGSAFVVPDGKVLGGWVDDTGMVSWSGDVVQCATLDGSWDIYPVWADPAYTVVFHCGDATYRQEIQYGVVTTLTAISEMGDDFRNAVSWYYMDENGGEIPYADEETVKNLVMSGEYHLYACMAD